MDHINLSLFGNKLLIKKVDISGEAENIELSRKHNVLSVPTIIIGKKRLSSAFDENDVVDAILQGFLSSVQLDEDITFQ
jgi:predicted thioredoxin/glutaredoxin